MPPIVMEAQQEPPEEDQEDVDWQQDQDPFAMFKLENITPLLFFAFGICVQTYKPVTFTVFLAELTLGITLACMFMIAGVFMTTQIPLIGLLANMINYHLKMPHMISYQLMPLPMN